MRAAILTVLVLAAACGGPPPSPCGPFTGKVTNIVDGDTVDLESGVRIRMLLVDTPETTSGKTDCYGQQAKSFTSMQLLNKDVTIAYDSVCLDRYGRTLAYLSVGGVEHNRALVEQGFACMLYIAPDGQSRKSEFEEYQSTAKTDRKGLWGACSTVTCG